MRPVGWSLHRGAPRAPRARVQRLIQPFVVDVVVVDDDDDVDVVDEVFVDADDSLDVLCL